VTPAAPTLSQIKAQVAAIRQRSQKARVIGIQAAGRWTGEPSLQDAQVTYFIQQCDSPLAMRLALRETVSNETIKVLITPLDETDLDMDILLRLAKQRLFKINSWQIVQSLFQATAIDPRLMRYGWLADYLMNWAPPEGYPPVSGGFLDAETAWSILLDRSLGLVGDRPDLLTLLKWSLQPENIQRYQSAPAHFRAAMVDWLTLVAGPAAAAVLQCVFHNPQPDALPIGLASEVVFHPANGRLDRAIGKLEATYLGGTAPNAHLLKKWTVEAIEVLRLQISDPQQRSQFIQRADAILQTVGAEDFAYLSRISLLGFDQRLAQFGEQLLETLRRRSFQALERLTQAYQYVKDHDQATQHDRRLARLKMALRLARWLVQTRNSQATQARSLDEAITDYLQEGSFLDWARLSLSVGDPVRRLSEALETLFEQVTERQEQQAQRFATLLQSWIEMGSTANAFTPLEKVLETIVAPLADHAPVLIIVMDGMSVTVCRELVVNITNGYDWTLISPQGQASALLAGLAALPSVTEASRTSLLCGQLRQGKKAEEEKGFAAHPALSARCRSGSPPVLFHKPSLRAQADTVLASEVRQAIASPQTQVVGVVVNAVDDHLAKGDQIDVSWTLDNIRMLSTLLHEAKQAQRLVVLLSDHGHVIEHKTIYQPHEGKGEGRWRAATSKPETTECLVKGDRVVIPASKTLIAPWTEQLRYITHKNNGYHGGLNPQEMVIPIAVLCSTSSLPEHWDEAPVDLPSWWEDSISQSREATLRPMQSLSLNQPDYGPLFSAVPAQQSSEWITTLLASPIYQAQKKRVGRSALQDDDLTQILRAIELQGNPATLSTLARSLNCSVASLRDRLTKLQRLLNIDGYSIVNYEKRSNVVELKIQLLCQQFDLMRIDTAN
jgi:PglZ domain